MSGVVLILPGFHGAEARSDIAAAVLVGEGLPGGVTLMHTAADGRERLPESCQNEHGEGTQKQGLATRRHVISVRRWAEGAHHRAISLTQRLALTW